MAHVVKNPMSCYEKGLIIMLFNSYQLAYKELIYCCCYYYGLRFTKQKTESGANCFPKAILLNGGVWI